MAPLGPTSPVLPPAPTRSPLQKKASNSVSAGTVAPFNNGQGTLSAITGNGPLNEGVTLTAGAISGDPEGNGNGNGTAYQWYRNNVAISSANSASYTTSATGFGTYKVQVTYGDGQGFSSSVTSADQTVAKINNGAAIFTVSGAAGVGQTLTASVIEDDVDGNGAFGYQWQSYAGTTWSNVGTNAARYTVASADQGKQLQLVVSYQDGQGFGEVATVAIGNVPVVDDVIAATGNNTEIDGGVGNDRVTFSGDNSNYTISGSTAEASLESITSIKQGKTVKTVVTPLNTLKNVEIIQITGGVSNNIIHAAGGTTLGETRPAYSGTLVASGGAGVDTIRGGSFKNLLAGRGMAAGVSTGVETITGTTNATGGAIDIFDLRNDLLTGMAYTGGGNADYVKVANFNVGTDKLVLTGQASDYKFTFTQTTGGGKVKTVTDEYWTVSTFGGDLIAQIRGNGIGTIAGFSGSSSVLYGSGEQVTAGFGF